jgi:metal-responsive CopG/Arc/MetJ family transcriptional regulator
MTLAQLAFLTYYGNMKRSIAVLRKKRGRPATGQDPVTAIRLPVKLRSRLDAWCKQQEDQPSRSEAIRRILEQALADPLGALAIKRKAQQASDLADRAAEQIVNKSMPMEEQESRKRAVIKGPKEFRDIREDQPKPK